MRELGKLEIERARFVASFGISTILHSFATKESGGSDGKSAWTRYQKVLGSIPSQITDFFSFVSNNTLHKPYAINLES